MTQASKKKERFSVEMFLRVQFKDILDKGAALINSLGLLPNTITIIGLVGNFLSAFLLGMGYITWGGIVMLVMGPIDALDGSMARLRGHPTQFGGFVDSVTDRYSELVLMLGLLVYYLRQPVIPWLPVVLIYFAASGSVLVSYIRARAEAAGYDAHVGLLSRVERYLVLAPSLIFNYPMVGLWVIALFSNFTALQRIAFVRKQAYAAWIEKNDKTALP